MTKKFGALPPPGLQWQVGKTAASIAFVNEAEAFLQGITTQSNEDASNILLLRSYIERVKSGEVVLMGWLTPQEYLAQQHIK